MRKVLRVAIVLVIVVGVMAVGPSALAAGKQPVTFTEHEDGFTDTFTDVFCVNGENVLAEITIVESGVFHVTDFGNGLYHVTGTFVGTFEAVPVGTSTTYTGRYTVWFGDNNNKNVDNTTFTFRANGVGSDGTHVRFGDVAHITAEEIGWDPVTDEPVIVGARSMFEKSRCA